jgi:hypothetical protein
METTLPHFCEPPLYDEIIATARQLAYQDQFQAAARDGLTFEDIRDLPSAAGRLGKIFSLEAVKNYIDNVPFPKRGHYYPRGTQVSWQITNLRMGFPRGALPKKLEEDSWFRIPPIPKATGQRRGQRPKRRS